MKSLYCTIVASYVFPETQTQTCIKYYALHSYKLVSKCMYECKKSCSCRALNLDLQSERLTIHMHTNTHTPYILQWGSLRLATINFIILHECHMITELTSIILLAKNCYLRIIMPAH